MKLVQFLFLLFPCTIGLKAQDLYEFSAVDQKARMIPREETYSTNAIANYITLHFKSNRDKLRAAYTWVTDNIRYNTDSMYSINWGDDPEKKITAALRRRKGVCENYAAIFTDIALKCGIPSFVVTGYTRQGGSIVRTGHSWNAVKVNNDWFLCDPTWDEAFRSNAKYFLLSPEEFIQTHIPFDPLWQLLDYPVKQQEFNRAISYSKKNSDRFNYLDTAKAFFAMSELEQLESSSRRIREAGVVNDLQKNWLAYNKMKIAIFYEDDDMNLYNSAVEDLNTANTVFNKFVHYRNNQFIPVKGDAELNTMLDPIASHLSAAFEKVNKIGRKIPNFQYDTGELKNRLYNLTRRVQEQKDFLKRYFASSVADRGKLFYR